MSERVDVLAAALRDETPELDELSKARMERDLLERRAAPAPVPERSRAPIFLAGLAVGAAAAVLLTVAFVGGDEPGPLAERPEPTKAVPMQASEDPSEGAVAFEALRDGVPVRRGHFAEGETVQTAEGQLMRVRFGGERTEPTSLVEVSPESRVRFPRAWGDDLEVLLERGNVRVEFHPNRRGQEHLVVRTRDGRVEVVGTAFEVRLGPMGTEVVVDEGTVRLVAPTGEPRLVSRGERAWLRRELAAAPAPRPAVPVEPEVVAENMVAENIVAESAARAEEAPAERPSLMAPTLRSELRFDLADRYFAQGRFDQARHELYAITRSAEDGGTRAQAWVRVAEAFARESDFGQAAEAYRRAARAGRGTPHGDGALFALGRLLEDRGDREGALAAHQRYLEVAPRGALASEARRALCSLGEAQHCAR